MLGTPVVATGMPGVREVVDHGRTGLVVRPGSRLEVLKAVEELVSDRKVLRQFASNARALPLSNLDVREVGAEYASLYRRLISDGAARPQRTSVNETIEYVADGE